MLQPTRADASTRWSCAPLNCRAIAIGNILFDRAFCTCAQAGSHTHDNPITSPTNHGYRGKAGLLWKQGGKLGPQGNAQYRHCGGAGRPAALHCTCAGTAGSAMRRPLQALQAGCAARLAHLQPCKNVHPPLSHTGTNMVRGNLGLVHVFPGGGLQLRVASHPIVHCLGSGSLQRISSRPPAP